MNAAKLLQRWKSNPPKEATCEEALAVMRHLGMTLREGSKGHWVATHPRLRDDDVFPRGTVTISCHAYGKAGIVHARAVRDILQAAKLIASEGFE